MITAVLTDFRQIERIKDHPACTIQRLSSVFEQIYSWPSYFSVGLPLWVKLTLSQWDACYMAWNTCFTGMNTRRVYVVISVSFVCLTVRPSMMATNKTHIQKTSNVYFFSPTINTRCFKPWMMITSAEWHFHAGFHHLHQGTPLIIYIILFFSL